jgi:hypothetical protein
MTDILTNIYIPSQFPSFYQGGTGNNFVSFVKTYYQYLEQSNNIIYNSRNFLKNHDIDTCDESFLQYFKNQYLGNLPSDVLVNPRLLIKHIQDLYRSVGTERGYELLFRILFNEDINFYYPGQHILRPSNNTWVRKGYIEVTNSSLLFQLVGLKVYSSSSLASALVEDYNIITVNNKLINVLILSNISGSFKYGDFLLSSNLPSLTTSNAPIIIGSLSAISITDGGAQFNLGDIVNISGSSASGLGRVSSVTSQNGKIIFTLVNGGFGFTKNAQVQVTGGGGSGATFSIGSLTNQKVFSINNDEINLYYNTLLDNYTLPNQFTLNISNTYGTFSNSEVINSSANGIILDFAYISGNSLSNLEFLSNTSLGISNLQIIEIDNPSFVNLTGPESSLNNANLVSGILLKGSVSNNIIYINTVLPKCQYIANGTTTFANSTTLKVTNATGYFLPTSIIYGQTSSANGYLNSTIRNTNWGFPMSNNGNLDIPINQVLEFQSLIVGTISSITGENPGENYSSNATVSIIESEIYQLQISDGMGGYWGGDANVSAVANNESGIITSLQVIESGYGFSPGEPLSIYGNGQIYAEGSAIVDGTGITQGYWINNQSFLSDEIYLQDSYYYQTFSYEILAPKILSTYQKFVYDIVHPIQMKMFGRFTLNDIQNSNTFLLNTTITQSNVTYIPSYFYLGF